MQKNQRMHPERKSDRAHQTEVAGQHAVIGNTASSAQAAFQRTTHPDAQWFPEAGLGLFLCWGISSVLGEGDLGWSMMAKTKNARGFRRRARETWGEQAVWCPITPEKYWAQADRFNPAHYDPVQWLSAAREAGFRYAVLTTKHHDGYAMWPSAYGEFSTRTHMGGRDLVGDFVEACRTTGLKAGLYYSPPDWYYNRTYTSFNYGNDEPHLDTRHRPVQLPVLSPAEQAAWDENYRRYIRGQIEELLTRYGPIDVFWFDGSAQDAVTIDWIRSLQPGIVVNQRGLGYGDFQTPEARFPSQRIEGWWEYCHIWQGGPWGYLNHEIYKPAGWMLSELVKARSWGGNFLPDMTPRGDGRMPDAAYLRFAQVAEWMETHAVSVFDVKPGPWPEQCNLPVTCREGTWFVHVTYDDDGHVELRDIDRPSSVRLLRDGTALDYVFTDRRLTLDVHKDLRTLLVDTIEVSW